MQIAAEEFPSAVLGTLAICMGSILHGYFKDLVFYAVSSNLNVFKNMQSCFSQGHLGAENYPPAKVCGESQSL